MNITLAEATTHDLFQIFELQQETWLDTYPNNAEGLTVEDIQSRFIGLSEEAKEKRRKRYQRRLDDPDIHFMLAKHNQKVVGYCEASKREGEHRIYGIYVSPEYQRQGIGRRLIGDAFSWLGDEEPIFLNVASYNKKAINFYKKYEFTQTGKTVQDPAGALPSGAVIPEIEMKKNT